MQILSRLTVCSTFLAGNLGLASGAALAQSRPPDRAPTVATRPVLSFCTRKSVNFGLVAKELTAASVCGGKAACVNGSWGNFETKRIAGSYGSQINHWLWSTSQDTIFTVPLQDSIIQDARNYANANRPAGKTVETITYFTDIIPAQDWTGYLIGADVRYANCVGGAPLPK